ncbi:MAG: regulatory iron-sulfur-containing complex subunit RicT [Candidatus Treponema excrementipullorum]|uniref:PSP1 C-terminal domain-containing protein n=1 Tax=Candidatus Treponema excrementipullorum TaxID=2838768 RepID=A0A9E2L1J8_9SPIR|nr:hypothetical protein [Candidatus Treponema excrementipullorum]MCI6480173.1 hypothetical protein [Spirochaetia bacterium]MCI6952524.1 hypothetical protein [Spirochaetia bacterium]MCI7588109.1 hypothetical protein [Spirochaetia bacterium]MDD7012601.1 regulatory iron-sulfur-containing complex subunit RicT [Candidatus Treponema excrementipullorum]
MSDIFENDIDKMTEEDLSALEDQDVQENAEPSTENYVYPDNMFRLKLEYSCEGVYAVSPENMELHGGDYVIIPTKYGKDYARVMGPVTHPIGIQPDDIIAIERKANDSDIQRARELKAKEADAFKVFQEKVAIHKLDMKLITTHYLLEEQKVLFFFSAEKRVDFRELVKDLVSVFKMRIELRQIGVRDEPRITGGVGICGRPYCCHAISDKLKPVSIRMAKEQNLSLNSMKISGQCGRLLCCLSYEYDWYTEAKKQLPSEGIKLFYDGTHFRVTEVNPLTGQVQMSGEDGRLITVNANRFLNHEGRWKLK